MALSISLHNNALFHLARAYGVLDGTCTVSEIKAVSSHSSGNQQHNM